jgi:thiosulfate/3-mercaptopyruvate sulfurtransferase
MVSDKGYAHPEALVSTEWAAENLNNPKVRLIESNEDPLLYAQGHIPGAIQLDWTKDLNDQIRRDYISKEQFEALCEASGISNDTTVVFYGDKNNWWATYAFWVFKLFGHEDARIMDGGSLKWTSEGRETTRDVPSYPKGSYKAQARTDYKIRAFREQVLQHVQNSEPMVDVRSPGEFSGELTHMPNYPQEGALRGGHIPGAKSIPWSKAANEDGTFKSAGDLRDLYEGQNNFSADQNIIAYCRIGERSSHTWFVLSYLLGYPNVRNYDGSWTEWGNSVGVPIEK